MDQDQVGDLRKAFQDEYCLRTYPHMRQGKYRGAFGKEAHQLIGALGDIILRAVLATGLSANFLKVTFLPEVRDSENNPRVQTRRAEQPTEWQDASKLRRKGHWEQNKAAVAVRQDHGCEICYVRHARVLRSCLNCKRPCCITCLPLGRSCCVRCPAVDCIEPGREPPQLCDKCHRKCPECSHQCRDCELWLCVFCIFLDTKRCRRNCHHNRNCASHQTSMSSNLHAQSEAIRRRVQGGYSNQRAFELSRHVDSQRTDYPSTYERCLNLL